MASLRSKSRASLYFACTCSYMAALSFGYMIGFSSPAIPDMEKKGLINANMASWFGSLPVFGALFGSILGGRLVETIGRKPTILLTCFPYFLGNLLIGYGVDMTYFLIGRFLTGVASGITVCSAPMYISEISSPDYRGMLGSGVQLSITIGICLVYILGVNNGYQLLANVGMAIPVLALFLGIKVPESPSYLLMNKKRSEALLALFWLDQDASQAEIEEDCSDLEDCINPNESVSFRDLVKPELLDPLKVSLGLMALQQFTGINVIMFYTVSIFDMAGFGSQGGFATIIIGIVQVIFTVLSCFLMDRAGRRVLLIFGGVGMACTNVSLGIFFYLKEMNLASDLGWLALSSLVSYIIFFSIGWGPVPILVTSEIFPVKARGPACAMATLTSFIAAFIVTKEFMDLQNYLGPHGAFFTFGSFCVLAVIFVFKYLPETKGKSLDDIEMFFRAKSGIR